MTDAWQEVSVEDLAAPGPNAMSTGPFGSAISSRFFRLSGVPVIRGSNLSVDPEVRLRDDGLVFLEPAKAAEFSRSVVRRGDLVFTSWGTINQVGLIDDSAAYDEYVISNKQMKLTPDTNKSVPEFLYYLFSAPEMQRQILDGAIGTGVPGFNLTRLRSLNLRIPPRPEQERIAAAMSEADATAARLQQAISKKRALKQGLLQELLTGRSRLPGFNEVWQERTFAEVARPVSDRVLPGEVPPDTQLIDLEQIESGTGRVLSRSAASSATSLKVAFKAGDVLFGKLRAYLRKFWLADSDGLCTTEIWALRACAGIHSAYVRFVVETSSFVDAATGAYGTHMPRSDWNVVRAVELLVPGEDEQRAIADVLSDVDDELDALGRRLAKARAVKHGMMQELLTGQTRLPAEGAAA